MPSLSRLGPGLSVTLAWGLEIKSPPTLEGCGTHMYVCLYLAPGVE